MFAAFAVASALYAREQTGVGPAHRRLDARRPGCAADLPGRPLLRDRPGAGPGRQPPRQPGAVRDVPGDRTATSTWPAAPSGCGSRSVERSAWSRCWTIRASADHPTAWGTASRWSRLIEARLADLTVAEVVATLEAVEVPCRPDLLARPGLRRSADRAPGASAHRPAPEGRRDQRDRLPLAAFGDAARRSGWRRRCSASTPTRCSASLATAPTRSPHLHSDGAV